MSSSENNQDTTVSSTFEQDQKTQAQLDAIEKEIKSNQSLTSNLQPISNLAKLYESDNDNDSTSSNQHFIKGCEYLSTKYKSWRMIRGDGNCYYRAFLYAVCEELLRGCCAAAANDDNSSAYTAELDRLKDYGMLKTNRTFSFFCDLNFIFDKDLCLMIFSFASKNSKIVN